MAKLKFDAAKQFDDPRDMPAYGIPLAAHYLRIPVGTLQYWVRGKRYSTDQGMKHARPVIALPDPKRALLSFFNVVEAHILRALRKETRIQLPHIRKAIQFLEKKYGKTHPLLRYKFKTDGVSLFVDRLGKLIDVSGFGQLVMPEMMEHLERLDFKDELVSRLYPFTRPHAAGPKTIFIDPQYSFGRPVLARICIPTSVIAERYEAGESVGDLARDYGCEPLDIEEAIRCELSAKAA
jgi:uncharacterized protein (DUF433 family)